MMTQPRHAPTATAHVLFHAHLKPGAAAGLSRTQWRRLAPRPRRGPSLATPSRAWRPAASWASAASMGCGPHAKHWSAHASNCGTSSVTRPWWPSEPSSVATTYSTSSGSRLEGVDLHRRRRAKQKGHAAVLGQRVIDERPHPGHAQAAGHEQQVAAARVDLEAAPQWTQHLDLLRRLHPRQPRVPTPVTRKWMVIRPPTLSTVLIENGRRRTRPE